MIPDDMILRVLAMAAAGLVVVDLAARPAVVTRERNRKGSRRGASVRVRCRPFCRRSVR